HPMSLDFLIKDGTISDIQRASFEQSIKIEDFWTSTNMTNKAKLIIEGDGIGNLTIQYNQTKVQAQYDPSIPFSSIGFVGGVVSENELIESRIDNIIGTYQK